MDTTWHIFEGEGIPHDDILDRLPPPPHWRHFHNKAIIERTIPEEDSLSRRLGPDIHQRSHPHTSFLLDPHVIQMVNAALYLRRPLMVSGPPGTGKSTLAYAIAHELMLGKVLKWSITSRTLMQDALYRYDAIGRLQEANLNRDRNITEPPEIGRYIRLGPLGTALLPSRKPRVLLIDEIDKSDIDLPNDLLNIFEDGEFEIPELARLPDEQHTIHVFPHDGEDRILIVRGKVACHAFPIIVITNNDEREMPAPFLRRCLRVQMDLLSRDKLVQIINSHYGPRDSEEDQYRQRLIAQVLEKQKNGRHVATDQLLNAIYMVASMDKESDLHELNPVTNAILQEL
ncbi:MAG: MoxR family ATPase [Chloroflexota bacterium]